MADWVAVLSRVSPSARAQAATLAVRQDDAVLNLLMFTLL
ncbi:protein of unknown function; putative exported protein [Methylorubrum extorquens DM4]|uniref:Uncharacterized protein n=1 Tax=Methylorubrum extorquens (strain DSM 6343 / CIP 106787 / DM4) TaxID=661410 RepID=C7C848_METED|nr:protein of unknown function; putative exported protein [Methylorubrum extorquens DM4]